MTVSIAVLGAGGKMGTRVTRSLLGDEEFDVRHVEAGDAGRARLRESGVDAVALREGLDGAQIVLFAVPDRIVRQVAAEVVPLLDPGASMLFLDPAACAADRIPHRDDVNCYVMHPTHPPLYSLLAENDPSARRDFWGGGDAQQAIVFATAWGDDGAGADHVERVATRIFRPISRSHRITVDQMAMLEPALTETLTNGCVAVIREGMERVIAAGVPEAATRDFLMGHLQIGIAILFEELDWRLSDGAQQALDASRSQIFREDWYRVLEPEAIAASVRAITGGD